MSPRPPRARRVALAVALGVLLVTVDLLLMDQDGWTVPVAVAAAACLALLARRIGLGVGDLGLGRDRLGAGLKVGGLLSAIVVLGYAVATRVSVLAPAFEDARVPDEPGAVLLRVAVVIPLRTVLLEELAFRGVLWGWLASAHDERTATWVSAVAFGLWHVPPALVVLQTNEALSALPALASVLAVGGIVAGTTAAGLLFAELRRRTGSLAAPALLHWTVNASGTLGSHLLR